MDTQLPPLFKRGTSPLTRLVFFALLSLLYPFIDTSAKHAK